MTSQDYYMPERRLSGPQSERQSVLRPRPATYRIGRRRRLAGLILIGLLAILTAAACAPVPGKVLIASDSTGFLANWYGADWRGAEGNFTLGARASTHQAWVDEAIADPERSPQVLVMIYGHNYVPTGMSAADQLELGRMVHSVMDNGGCVVLVLPAYMGTDPQRVEMIGRYRTWATGVADRYPTVVTADWQPVAEAQPEAWVNADGTPTDGIHMSNQAVGVAWSDAVNAGVDMCFEAVR